jgi:hypothetical protein
MDSDSWTYEYGKRIDIWDLEHRLHRGEFRMPQFDWMGLLRRWNQELLECAEITQMLPANVIESSWLGYPPASEDEISQLEDRLGANLPSSYRAFFKVTNGWRVTGFFVGKLWSTHEVEWLHTRHQDLIDNWLVGEQSLGGPLPVPNDKYFVYGDEQEPYHFRLEYLQTTLDVSEIRGTNMYLLNPHVKTLEGEWEAWFFAHWLPGARRYTSFWDLMQAEYERLLRLKGRRTR